MHTYVDTKRKRDELPEIVQVAAEKEKNRQYA